MHLDLVVRTLFMASADDTHVLLRQSEISKPQMIQQCDERSLVFVPAVQYPGFRFPWPPLIRRGEEKILEFGVESQEQKLATRRMIRLSRP
jgi:hypothetical protein